MAKKVDTTTERLQAMAKILDEKMKNGDQDAYNLLNQMLVLFFELNQRVMVLEREISLPDSFINPNDANNRLR